MENGKLKKDIEQLRAQLQDKQRRRTSKTEPPGPEPSRTSQIPPEPSKTLQNLPEPSRTSQNPPETASPLSPPLSVKALLAPPPPNAGPPSSQRADPGEAATRSPEEAGERQNRRRRREGKGEEGREEARRDGGDFDLVVTPAARPAADALPLEAEPRLDVSRLDLRVGRLVSARRHPHAATLSVQEVDVGEKVPRPVVSSDGEKPQMEEVEPLLRSLVRQSSGLWSAA